MKNLKVRRFHHVARNAVVFMGLSLFFLVLQKSLQSNLPFLNPTFLTKAVVDEWFVVLDFIPCAWIILSHNKNSHWWLGAFCILVSFRTLESLFLDFNKLLVIVLFAYVSIAYALFQLIRWTFERASFSPNFKSDTLAAPMAKKIPVVLAASDQSYKGHLSNWDSAGAFIYSEAPFMSKDTHLNVTIYFEGREFGAIGTVVCTTWDRRGLGLEWSREVVPEVLTWESLVGLLNDLGWSPQLLR